MIDISILVIGIILWFSLYMFLEVKVEKIAALRAKPFLRALLLFFYMYIDISLLRLLIYK